MKKFMLDCKFSSKAYKKNVKEMATKHSLFYWMLMDMYISLLFIKVQ